MGVIDLFNLLHETPSTRKKLKTYSSKFIRGDLSMAVERKFIIVYVYNSLYASKSFCDCNATSDNNYLNC